MSLFDIMIPVWLTDTITSDLDRALHYTTLWGLEGVELRTVGGASHRVPFVNEAKLRRRLEEHEMPVAAIVPGLFEGPASDRLAWMNEVAALEETLQFCDRIGCRCIVTSAFAHEDAAETDAAADALHRAAERCARHGIALAVLNERDAAFATGTKLAALLARVDHPLVRAAWNPAAALAAGEDPRVGLEALLGHIALVRCANVRRQGPVWEPALLAEGAIDWEAHLRRLAESGFAGPISMKMTVDPKPRNGLGEATYLIRLIRSVRKALGR